MRIIARLVFNKDALFDKPEALNGYRVLSCTQYILGPCAAAYLGELGAEVIKIEVPRLGEPMRHCSPYNETWFYPVSRWNPGRGTSPAFQGANHNEYFVTLDYRKPEAKEIFYNMVQKTDAMVWNYRPGTFDRWKIGYGACKEVNPRIVLAWCGGFGGFGPGRNWASYDILGQAKGGVFSFTGHRAGRASAGFPSKHTTWIMDYSIGMLVSTAMLAGLYWRDTVSGLGNYFECSQVQGSTRYTEYALPLWGRNGIVRMRWGNWDTEICVNGICRLRPDLLSPFGPSGGEGRGLHLRSGLYRRRFRQADEPHRPPRPGQKVRQPRRSRRGPGPGRDLSGHRGLPER